MNWYYDAGAGQRQGPVSDPQLQALLDAGTINSRTLVWREGMADWAPLEEARPTPTSTPGSDSDTQRCDSCGNFVPPSRLIQIGARRICADCKPAVMQQLQSGSALPELSSTERNGPAWEQREELGAIPAAWTTIKSVLTLPVETFSNMKREGGLSSPLIYNLLLSSIGNFAALIYQFGLNFGMGSAQGMQNPILEPLRQNPALAVGAVIGAIFAIPAMMLLISFLHSGIIHLSLMICGGAKQPFETTFRVSCYASGSSNILQVIPFCGAMVAGLWGLVVTCIGIAKAHEISTGRAVVAVLLPSFLCCALAVVIISAVIGLAAAGGQNFH